MPRLQREPSAAQLKAREAGAARLRAAREAKIKQTMPTRSTRGMTDVREHAPKNIVREMPSTGRARIEEPVILTVDRPQSNEKLKNLAFAEEVLTILVHDSTDKNDEPIPYVINGGRRQAFIRGREQEVKRKFVEVLARMKRTTYTQEKYKDSQGIDSIRNIGHSGLVFPFTVIRDPNPNGKAWLKAISEEQ